MVVKIESILNKKLNFKSLTDICKGLSFNKFKFVD